MTPSDACYDLIRRFEDCRLQAYPDPGTGGKPWSIGYGHTKGVGPTDTCTQQAADAWLIDDVATAATAVARAVKSPLTQSQFDALVSLVYNVGPGVKGRRDGIVRLKSGEPSTLLRRLNSGDYAGAAREFTQWRKAGGRVLTGLVRRRAAERALFEKGDAEATAKPLATSRILAGSAAAATAPVALIVETLQQTGAEALQHGVSAAQQVASFVPDEWTKWVVIAVAIAGLSLAIYARIDDWHRGR